MGCRADSPAAAQFFTGMSHADFLRKAHAKLRRRTVARLNRLDELFKRVRQLERARGDADPDADVPA